MEEQQALVRLKQGDLESLEILVQLYQVRAVQAAALITGDRAQAEDIVQNAFIRAAQRIDQYDLKRPFGPWFLRSVVNDAIKALHQQRRWVSIDENESEEPVGLFDPTPLPEEVLEAEETRQEIWQALQQLSPNQRATVVLRYYLDMPEQEIAEQLNGPAGTVRWWLFAAKQRLAKLLSHQSDAHEPRRASSSGVHKSGEQQ